MNKRQLSQPLTQALCALVCGFFMAFPAQAQGVGISSDLCARTFQVVHADLSGGATLLDAHFEGGVAWQVGFVGELTGAADVNFATITAGTTRAMEVSTFVCIDSVALYKQMVNGELTWDQYDVAMRYFGTTDLSSQQQEEIRSALLQQAALNGLNPVGVEAAFRPFGSIQDSLFRAVGGELSHIDALDETVFVFRGMVDALPVPVGLRDFFINPSESLFRNTEIVNEDPLSVLCPDDMVNHGQAGSVLEDLCLSLQDVKQSGELLTENIQGLIGFAGDVQKELKGLNKIVRRAKSVISAADRSAKRIVSNVDDIGGEIDDAVQRIFATGGAAQAALESVGDSLKGVADNIVVSLNNIKNTVTGTFNKIKGKVEQELTEIKNTFDGVKTFLDNLF